MKFFDIIGKSALEGHKVLIVFTLILTALGVVLGFYFLPDEWSGLRRLVAGGLAGFGVGGIIVTSRVTGAFQDHED